MTGPRHSLVPGSGPGTQFQRFLADSAMSNRLAA